MLDPTLELLRDRLVVSLAPKRILLFGSRALGTAQPDSDYDLLVVAETDLPLEDRMLKARRAVREIRVPKDILVVTPNEFRKFSTWRTGAVREAAEHGEVIYEAV